MSSGTIPQWHGCAPAGLLLVFLYGIALHRLGFMKGRRKCKRSLSFSLGFASLACCYMTLALRAMLHCGCGGVSSMRGAWEVARAKVSSRGLKCLGTVLSACARMWLPSQQAGKLLVWPCCSVEAVFWASFSTSSQLLAASCAPAVHIA